MKYEVLYLNSKFDEKTIIVEASYVEEVKKVAYENDDVMQFLEAKEIKVNEH